MSKMTNKKDLCGCICNFDTLGDYGQTTHTFTDQNDCLFTE